MESWKQFLTWEKSTKDTIDFKKMYVDIIGRRDAGIGIKKDKKGNIVNGDVVSGLLLSQIIYWYLPNKNNKTKLREKRFGHHWIVKEREEWWDEIRITESNYKTSIKRLEDENLIVKKVFKPAVFGRQKTATCIRLNIEEFLKRINQLMEYEQSLIDDNDIDNEFEQYLEEQFDQANSEETQEESGTVDLTNPNGDMGTVDLTIPKERSNQPILRNGEIDQSLRTDESTDPYITETLSRDFETESLTVCVEEQRILDLIESRSDLKPHTQNIISILNKKKNNESFKYDVFEKTLIIIDVDIKGISYLENALMNNLKKGFVKDFNTNNNSINRTVRKEQTSGLLDDEGNVIEKKDTSFNEMNLDELRITKKHLNKMLERNPNHETAPTVLRQIESLINQREMELLIV